MTIKISTDAVMHVRNHHMSLYSTLIVHMCIAEEVCSHSYPLLVKFCRQEKLFGDALPMYLLQTFCGKCLD